MENTWTDFALGRFYEEGNHCTKLSCAQEWKCGYLEKEQNGTTLSGSCMSEGMEVTKSKLLNFQESVSCTSSSTKLLS